MARKKKQSDVVEEPIPVTEPEPRLKVWMLAPVLVVVLIVGFVVAVAINQGRRPPVRVEPRDPQSTATNRPTPSAWFYDPVTNQHWDPNHNHWHDGRPPAQNHAGMPERPVPNIPNPKPWQYDAATNQHWNPERSHWHAGPPPADQAPPASAPVEDAAPTPAAAPESAPAPESAVADEPVEDVPASAPAEEAAPSAGTDTPQ